MALGSCFYHSLCQNSFINLVDNKFIGNPLRAPTKSRNFFLSTSKAFSHDFSLSLTLNLASTHAPSSAPASNNQVGRYTDKNLQKATKLALESFFQGQK